MADFQPMRLTAAGYRLRAAAEIGQVLEITRIGLGAGLAPDDISGLTALVDERQTADIEAFEAREDGTGLIRFYLSNADLTEGYSLREIGVYALDPDTGEELLIDYSYAGESYDTLPARGGTTVIEQVIDLITVIRPADNITAYLTSHRAVPPGGDPGDVLTISQHNTLIWAPVTMGDDVLAGLLALTVADVGNKARILRQESRLSQLDQRLLPVLKDYS